MNLVIPLCWRWGAANGDIDEELRGGEMAGQTRSVPRPFRPLAPLVRVPSRPKAHILYTITSETIQLGDSYNPRSMEEHDVELALLDLPRDSLTDVLSKLEARDLVRCQV
jgi:hypothetical protein